MGPNFKTVVLTLALVLGVLGSETPSGCRVNKDIFPEAHNVLVALPNCENVHSQGSPGAICEVIPNIHTLIQDITSKLPKLKRLILTNQNVFQTTREALQEHLHDLDVAISSLLSLLPDDNITQVKYYIQVQYGYFASAVQASLEEADDLQELYEREQMLRVVALIQPTRLGEAEVLFSQLNNNSLISEIMEELHSYQLDTYREGMMAFTTILHTVPLRVEAFLKWHDLLLDTGEHMENGIIILKQLVDAEVAGNPPPELEAQLEEIKITIDSYFLGRVGFWVRDIENDDIQEVIDYVSPNRLHMVGYTFSNLVPQLVQETMRKPVNFLQLLKFIQGLRWNIHKFKALNTLFDSVTSTERKLIVAYNVKQAMTNLHGPDPADVVLTQFQALKARIPVAIKTLIWHKECTIQSTYKADFLFSSPDKIDANNRHAYCRQSANLPDGRDGTYFQFVPKVDGDTISFNLVNFGYPQHFLEFYANLDASKADISFKSEEGGYHWHFEFDSVAVLNAKMRNADTQGYLTVHDQDEANRKVHIWRLPATQPVDRYNWLLDCVE